MCKLFLYSNMFPLQHFSLPTAFCTIKVHYNADIYSFQKSTKLWQKANTVTFRNIKAIYSLESERNKTNINLSVGSLMLSRLHSDRIFSLHWEVHFLSQLSSASFWMNILKGEIHYKSTGSAYIYIWRDLLLFIKTC